MNSICAHILLTERAYLRFKRRYEDLFTQMHQLQSQSAEDTLDFASDEEQLAIPLDFGTVDLGVKKWARMPITELMNTLGFLNSRPALFALWTARYEPHADSPQINEPIHLMWHQAVAVAAMSEQFWTQRPVPGGAGVPGVLLADNVGLGKTVEILALIAMVVQTRKSETHTDGVRAPIIGESSLSTHYPEVRSQFERVVRHSGWALPACWGAAGVRGVGSRLQRW